MRTTKCTAWFALALMLAIVTAGCTIKMSQLAPNTHFAYPNSNITPLGPVSAETSRTTVIMAKAVDQQMLDEVFGKALKEKGGDFLINAKITTTVTMIPIPILNIFITTLKVDGTAVKQTIGQQQLR